MNLRPLSIQLLLILLVVSACQEEKIAKPRPHQYPKIEMPAGEPASARPESCPFELMLPAYAVIEERKEEDNPHPCWFDIRMEDFSSTIHCSYYPITADRSYEELVDDAYTMASKHNVKAYYRDELLIETADGSKGIIFRIEGPVATPYQFYISDSTDHFLRGSLYFDQKIDLDSMQPIITMVAQDIDDMVGSIEWQ